MRRLLAPVLLLAVVAAGCGTTESSRADVAGPHNDADATFAQEMVPHHRQAVEMVAMTKGHDLDPQVQDIVDRIGSTQEGEVEEMTGWLRSWDEEVPAEDAPMRMQGMLSDQEMSELRDTPDPDFQRLWLTRMVGHHQGAIPMAQTELEEGKNPPALQLARDIIETQKAELYEMSGLIGQ